MWKKLKKSLNETILAVGPARFWKNNIMPSFFLTSMAAEAEKRYGKRRILLRFDEPRKVMHAIMRYRKGQPTKAPPVQSLGTRAAIVEDTKGENPASRNPAIAV